ncbi:MAG: hypothetical protein A2W25_12895 [candidate division Zixibacteria bacterium RBG_16_53_22]|nr:MAG: hypothetical protein A2W25_12895 [candidate division Zixibacteria bacterium RBG_16_53_22]
MNEDEQRMELARKHVACGHYDRSDVIEATAAAVVKSRALYVLLDKYEINAGHGSADNVESKEEKFTEIKRRIDDGFYDDPNCLAELAERIIRKMGIEKDE